MAVKPEECFNCGRTIDRMEQAYLWQENTVCLECHRRLSQAASPPPSPPRRRNVAAPSPEATPPPPQQIITQQPVPPEPPRPWYRPSVGATIAIIILAVVAIDYTMRDRPSQIKSPGGPGNSSILDDPGSHELAESGSSSRSFVDYGRAIETDGIRIEVDSASIGRVHFRELNEKGLSQDEVLQILVRITNIHDKRRTEFKGWGCADGFLESTRAPTLSDNIGYTYRKVRYGLLVDTIGQVNQASIYPGQTVTDLLIYHVPLPAAEVLFLKLPHSAFGAEGASKFAILLRNGLPVTVAEKYQRSASSSVSPQVHPQESGGLNQPHVAGKDGLVR